MPDAPLLPGSPADMRLAARLVVESVISEPTMRAVLAKAQELKERGSPLAATEICRRKGWVSASEIRWLQDPDHPPADLIPGFVVDQLIGQGGMSRVYRAKDLEGGRTVALKILLPALRRRRESVEEFEAEGRHLINLEHPNIVKGYAIGQHDGLIFVSMECVQGRSVQEYLDRAQRFSEDNALYIILQTARALGYLHEKGLIHRDVKPANILLDLENTVKICDLGFTVASGAPESEITAGTIQYIAPEQARGEGGLDVRSDIYSLGVSLFQLVVGKLPFGESGDREVLAARLLAELNSPELKSLRISQHVHYFIQRMMAIDPGIRYQSPAELISDIEEQIQGKKSLAGPASKGKGSGLDLERPFVPPVRPITRSIDPLHKRRPSR